VKEEKSKVCPTTKSNRFKIRTYDLTTVCEKDTRATYKDGILKITTLKWKTSRRLIYNDE
jgi:HSP20 family molecular chaperone IbpA